MYVLPIVKKEREMKRLMFTVILAAAMIVPTAASAQTPGEMLFDQGCDAFELVEDLTPGLGSNGRWLVQSQRNGKQLVYAWESVDIVPQPSDPTEFKATTFVAWTFEGTGISGTNRSDYSLQIVDEFSNITFFFQGETFRGNFYKSGGISGTAGGNLATGEFTYDAVRMVLCKQGLGGGGDD